MIGIAVGAAIIVGAGLGWWGAIAVAMAALVVALCDARRQSWLAAGLVVLAAGLGAWRVSNVEPVRDAPGGEPLAVAVVVSDPVRNGRYQHFVVKDTVSAAATRICVTADAIPVVRLGDWVALAGSGHAASDVSVGERAYLATRGCQWSFFATTVSIAGATFSPQRALADLRARFGELLHRAAPGDAGVLLSGLVTGDDEGFSVAREEAFVNSATKHLTAVSGSNLALVAGMCAAIGTATVGRHRMAWHLVSIAAIWGYALISGLQAPAIRAAIVTTGAILAFRVGRRPDFVTLIALAAGAMVLVEPRQIDGLGFRLSVAASLALAMVLPAMVERGRGAAAAGFVAATAAAQLATLPFLLPVFGTVSMLGLPANVLVAPFVAVAMPIAFGAAIIGLVSPGLGEMIAAPAALAATVALAIVDLFGAPGASLRFGMPPLDAAIAVAATCGALLLVLGGHLSTVKARWWRRQPIGNAEQAGRSVTYFAPPAEAPASPLGEEG